MIIRRISKEILEQTPYEEWNAYIDLLAMEAYSDLNLIQRVAHLCFWYDSEVQNGGHIQYFENQGTAKVDETIFALKTVGAMEQAELLDKAYGRYSSKFRRELKDIFEFVAASREGEYASFDSQYYECNPRVIDLLEDYYVLHKVNFVAVI
ncbi:hypothetical protein PAECIP111893_00713 [Paenibacillus plantiphilus]|uniref:DNA mimic protein DMP19 C-terminal domain-containing protein n=1 Tax=Paenibacillus plantiphilus TaxID=2905650 RepID=A0ABN8G5J0_9BACL|nr:DUF4375 domain-containing protein [Paenibacillus plantiphilus]CAH1195539.1 hypothetical protein PAECIP111893_00713 [Paenibacillus plantiphilus]